MIKFILILCLLSSGINGDNVAGLILERMEKDDVVHLYDRFFVKMPSIVEICIGRTFD